MSAAGQAPLLVLAAGGTGGHMFPAQALAETVLGRGWRVALASDERGLRYAGDFPAAVARLETPSASPSRGGVIAKLGLPVVVYRGIKAARSHFAADRPAVVAGFGGYPALPALAAGLSMGIPCLIHEQNAVLGRVNKLFAGRVAKVCCGTWPVTNPPAGADLVHIGNPVRAAVAAARDIAYAPPGAGPIRLLVFGGSQGASVFGRVVPQALAALPEALRARLVVTQQVREADRAAVAAAFEGAGIKAETAPFFVAMPDLIAKAHLVIARAGASTVAELTAIGRPALLVPYPHATDDHQSANARAISEAGGAAVIAEAGFTAATLARKLDVLLAEDGGAALEAMAAAAHGLGRPQAAADLADIVASLAGESDRTAAA